MAPSVVAEQDTARRIAKISAEAKLQLDETDYLDSFKPHMMDVVHSWCNGATFLQICKMTDIFEGARRSLCLTVRVARCV